METFESKTLAKPVSTVTLTNAPLLLSAMNDVDDPMTARAPRYWAILRFDNPVVQEELARIGLFRPMLRWRVKVKDLKSLSFERGMRGFLSFERGRLSVNERISLI
jgi:hypothetical protein